MGASHTTLSSTATASEDDATDGLVAEYVVDQRLYPGSGRMMRTFRLQQRSTGATFVAKTMYISKQQHNDEIVQQEKELRRIKEALEGQSHVAPFLFWTVGDGAQPLQPVALVRSHVYTTLSDRLESRPFLTHVEKLWIVYQLLDALQHMHNAGVVHGFITTENIGLTSWNYLVLLDIASYKPRTALPDDDPSEYLYYFQETHKQQGTDTTTREKRCYLAPERFYSPKEVGAAPEPPPPLSPPMDVFSVGCVLLETSLNGERALDLGDLMDYRKRRDFPPSLLQKFQKIESSSLRAACRHMLHLDASERLTPHQYLERLEPVMPKTFSSVLLPFMERVTRATVTPDARIALAAAHYGRILKATTGVHDAQGIQDFAKMLGQTTRRLELEKTEEGTDETEQSKSEAMDGKEGGDDDDDDDEGEEVDLDSLLGETNALLQKLEKMTFDEKDDDNTEGDNTKPAGAGTNDAAATPPSQEDVSSLLIFLQLILSNLRHVKRPSSKLASLHLLERLAIHSADDTRLQRITPTAISLLQDQDPTVRATALHVMTTTLSMIQSFSPSDSKVFPQYIFKRVAHLVSDPSLVVRVAFAECVAVLAETAHRFLDISHAVRLYEAVGAAGTTTPTEKQDDTRRDSDVFGDNIAKLLDGPSSQKKDKEPKEPSATKEDNVPSTLVSSTYHSELTALHETVSRWVVHMTTDQSEQSSPPKRALLRDLSRLCNFFGRDGVMAFILPQILAFLNDRHDWQLRAALFEDMPSVCSIIGRAASEHFVLPCLESALVDSEDQVMSKALHCLASLIDMGLVSRSVVVETKFLADEDHKRHSGKGLFEKYCPLLLYPSASVRHSAMLVVTASCKAFGFPDADVFLLPALRPYLRYEPSTRRLTTVEGLSKCLVKPWTREKLKQQIARLSKQPIISPEGIQWTSIDRDTAGGENAASSQETKLISSSIAQPTPSDQSEELDEHITEYLKMLSRSRNVIEESLKGDNLRKKLATGVEGSNKLAQQIKFPSQIAASSFEDGIPAWFSAARDIAAENPKVASEFSTIQSVADLSAVYGLSLVHNATPPGQGGPEQGGSEQGGAGASNDEDITARLRTEKALTIDAASAGEWGSESLLDPSLHDTTLLVTKLKGLSVPPLSPRLGVSSTKTLVPQATLKGMNDWRPKVDSLLASTSPVTGHAGPVTRLAVSHDDRFFVSGSFDSTCRVWQLGRIDESNGLLESSATYEEHGKAGNRQYVRVNDITAIEHSHSVASAASDGSVHVWRVDMVSARGDSSSHSSSTPNQGLSPSGEFSKVSGCSVVRRVNPREGEVLAVSHFNTLSQSVVAFATQRGSVHTWDIRSQKEPFKLQHEPELGYLTAMSLGQDRNWLLTGTNEGFLALWDVRFSKMVKLWSINSAQPINRLATTYAAFASRGLSARPFAFVACGSDCAMYDLADGICRQSFRVLDPHEGYNQSISRLKLPELHEVSIASRQSRALLRQAKASSLKRRHEMPVTSINTMLGVMGHEQPFLVTGGSDAHLRFWDFSTTTKCYTISGQVPGQPRPAFERVDFHAANRLMVCRQSVPPRLNELESSRVPRRLHRGMIRAENRHRDAIQDLKLIQGPVKALVSCSRDGSIKLWR